MRWQSRTISSHLKALLWPSLGTVLLVLLIGGGAYWMYWYLSTADRWAYTGKVVEKRTNRRETDFGGSLDWLLILEDEQGVRIAVRVTERVYAQAEIGKWVSRDQSGTHWYDSNPRGLKK